MLNWNSRQRAAPKIVKLRVFPLSAAKAISASASRR